MIGTLEHLKNAVRSSMIATTICLAGVGASQATDLEGVTIGSGSVGADFFVLGTALQQVVASAYPDGRIENSATTGSVENFRLLRSGDIDVGIYSVAPPTIQAWNGTHGFKGEKPYKEIRTLMGFFNFTYNIITLASSDIKTYQDLKGRRVAIGPDPATLDPFYSPFIEAHGVNYMNDLDRVYASYADIVRLLGDGQVDAIVGWTSGYKVPASIQQLASAKALRWVSMDKDMLTAAGLTPIEFAPGTLPNQDEPVVSTKLGFVAVAGTEAMSDDVAYAFVKGVHEKFGQLAELQPAVRQAVTDPTTMTTDTDPFPYHPGAIKYWKEVGLWNR